MALDFSKYLKVEVDSIEAPRAAPTGHYFATIQSWKGAERFYEGKGGPGTPVVEITFKISAPDDDASEEDPEGAQAAIGKIVTRDYQLNDETGLFGLRRLTGETVGNDTKGLDLADALDAAKSCNVKIYNEPRAGKEEGQFFNRITKVLPAE